METPHADRLRQRHGPNVVADTARPTSPPAHPSSSDPPPPPPPPAPPSPPPDTPGPPAPPPPPPQQQPDAELLLRQGGLAVVSSAAVAAGLLLFSGALAALALRDTARALPVVVGVALAAVTSVVFRVAVAVLAPVRGEAVQRFRRATRHLTGERAAYVRTSQRLAMLDRDFTAADYDMLLGLDDNSQRLRQFLEGASMDMIERLPAYTFKKVKRPGSGEVKEVEAESERDNASEVSEAIVEGERCAEEEKHGEKAGGGKKVVEEWAEEGGGETATSCTICLELFEDGMKIRILPCMHQFMADCIDPWLVQQARCPVCKSQLVQ